MLPLSVSMQSLTPLGTGTYVWQNAQIQPGATNAGVIVDDDGITVVDALISPAAAAALFEAVSSLGVPIRRLVLTSSHLAHVGGSGAFRLPGVYGTPQISAHMDQPPNLGALSCMYPDLATEIAAIDETPTRAVTHTVAEGAWLSPTAVVAPLPGELAENLVVQIPEERIVFAGAMASFGVTPMAGTGDPAAWAEALERVLEWGDIIIPGHGPIGGEEEVRELQAYLWACVEAAETNGVVTSGPWDSWAGRAYDEINIERVRMLAAGDDGPPPSLLRLLGMS